MNKTFFFLYALLSIQIVFAATQTGNGFTIKADDTVCTGSYCFIEVNVSNDLVSQRNSMNVAAYIDRTQIDRMWELQEIQKTSLVFVPSTTTYRAPNGSIEINNTFDQWINQTYKDYVWSTPKTISLVTRNSTMKQASTAITFAANEEKTFRIGFFNKIGSVLKWGFIAGTNDLDPFTNSTNYEAGNLSNSSNYWNFDMNTTRSTVNLSTDNKTFALATIAGASNTTTVDGLTNFTQTLRNGHTLTSLGTQAALQSFNYTGSGNATLESIAVRVSKGASVGGVIVRLTVYAQNASGGDTPNTAVIYGHSEVAQSTVATSCTGARTIFPFGNITFEMSRKLVFAVTVLNGTSGNGLTTVCYNATSPYAAGAMSQKLDGAQGFGAVSGDMDFLINISTSNSSYNTSANLYESKVIVLADNATYFTPSWTYSVATSAPTINATCDGDSAVPSWTGNLTNNTPVACPVRGDVFKYQIFLCGNSSATCTMQNITASFNFTDLPNVTTPIILPSIIYSDVNANASTIYSEIDGKAGTVFFRWYVNGSNVYNFSAAASANNSNISSTINEGNYSRNANLSVCVYATDNESETSTTVCSTNTTISGIPAAAPTNLTSPSQTKTSIYVTWTNPIDPNWNYTLLYYNTVNVVNTTNNSYNITGLNDSTQYNISVLSWSDEDALNTTNTSILQNTSSNFAPNITDNFPGTSPYNLSENATYAFNITATDDDNGNLFVEWFKDGISQLSEYIVSGASSVWNWATGYQDEGNYNITVNVSDEFNDTTSYSWNITVEDTYPVPENPLEMYPRGGQYEYSIPLLCVIDYEPVAPYQFRFVYGINGSTTNTSLNINDTDGFYSFDISNDAYGTNYTFGCMISSPTGDSNYTYSNTFTRVNINNFYLFSPEENPSYQHKTPYTLGFIAELQNSINATIYANLADCNGDGVWDYSWDLSTQSTTYNRKTFSCINARGSRETTIGMIMYKNNTASWDVLGCKDVDSTKNYCVVYKTYKVIIE